MTFESTLDYGPVAEILARLILLITDLAHLAARHWPRAQVYALTRLTLARRGLRLAPLSLFIIGVIAVSILAVAWQGVVFEAARFVVDSAVKGAVV